MSASQPPSGAQFTSPRACARAIFMEQDVSRQRDIFTQCPEHLRKLVRAHVRIWRALDDQRVLQRD